MDMSCGTKIWPGNGITVGPCDTQQQSAFALLAAKHPTFIAEALWASFDLDHAA
jgi:hypothetical protein